MQMATALKDLLDQLIQFHFIIKGRIKDIHNAILLVELYIFSVLDFSLGYFILCHATQDTSDSYVI